MTYCTKCGTKNTDDAEFCVKCGASLGSVEQTSKRYRRERREGECFGLPHGGAVFGLFIGAIIILWGLTQLFGWNIEIWTWAIIVIGVLMVAGAVYGLTRKRSS